MLCQRCKKNVATRNYVEIINGDKFESHLCNKCYQELYGELHSKLSDDVCAWLFGSSEPEKSCPVCGTTYADYKRTGLSAIHGKTEHVGKVGANRDEKGLHRKLKSLQTQLENALREKRFNEAGKLNKSIYEISKELYGGKKDD